MHNLLVNLTVFVKKHLERCTSFCVSCGRKLLDESVRLSPCNSDFCMFKFEEIFGVKLYPELQNNFPLVDLDLSLAAKAVYSTRALDIFEPFPTFFLKGREERSRSVFAKGTGIVAVNKENKDIETIRRILKSFPSPKSIKELSISEVTWAPCDTG
ncbi:MAG: hypothetical protein P4M11_15065 [Candidatus Pacebacteria bacterium]|nr:hypothetical protein [Candidatus Paceibacterota bacterium]